jgi:hypothetical protein
MRLASSLGLFYPEERTHHALSFPRATTETYALDSYQNLLFSLTRFHEITGRYPVQVTVVGYEMKRRRFEELHRVALRFPTTHFEYIGIEPPASDEESESARIGEVSVLVPVFLSAYMLSLTLLHESSLKMDTRHIRSTCMAVMTFYLLKDEPGTRSYGFIRIMRRRRSFEDCWSGVPMMRHWCTTDHYLGIYMNEISFCTPKLRLH